MLLIRIRRRNRARNDYRRSREIRAKIAADRIHSYRATWESNPDRPEAGKIVGFQGWNVAEDLRRAKLLDVGDERAPAVDRLLNVRRQSRELGDDLRQARIFRNARQRSPDLVVRRLHLVQERIDRGLGLVLLQACPAVPMARSSSPSVFVASSPLSTAASTSARVAPGSRDRVGRVAGDRLDLGLPRPDARAELLRPCLLGARSASSAAGNGELGARA